MRRRSRPLVTTALLAAALLGACGDQPSRVVVGLTVLDDPTQPYGAELAVEEINAAGGVGGIPLELATVLGVESPQAVLEEVERFASIDELVVVTGFVRSTPTISGAALYNQRGVPQIVAMATSPALTDVGGWTYRLCPTDDQQGAALAAYAVDSWGKRRMVVIRSNDDYGGGLARVFERRARELGGEVVATLLHRDTLHDDDKRILRLELEGLAGRRPPIDLVVLLQRYPAAFWTVGTIRQLGLAVDILGSDGLRLLSLVEADAGRMEGVRATKFFDPGSPLPRTRRFVDSYRRHFHRDPEDLQALTYDAVYLVRDAVLAGGPSRAAVKRYLDQRITDAAVLEGVAGSYRLAADHDPRRPFYIVEVRGGRFVKVAEVPSPEPDPAMAAARWPQARPR